MSRLHDYVADVIGTAIATPDRASTVFREAAQQLARRAAGATHAQDATALREASRMFMSAASRPDSISDFRDMLRETAESYQEVGEPQSDDMAVYARRREIHEERTPGLPRVSIAPKSVTEATRLGDVATLKWQPTKIDIENNIRQQNTIAFWQGHKEEAQSVTVDVGLLEMPTGVNGTGGPRPYGLVTYGSDGAKTDVKFDIAFGTRFTVVGSYVSVLAALNPPRADFPQGQVTVAASLGFFAAPSLAPVMYTEYIDGLSNNPVGNANLSALIQRPAKAMVLLPMQSSLALGTATIEFYALDGILPQYVVNWTNSAQNQPIPLSNDIAWLRVRNTGGGVANFRLPFQIAL